MGENPGNKAPCRTCGALDRNAIGRCRQCLAKRARRYFETHRDKVKENAKRWREANPEKAREMSREMSARSRAKANSIPEKAAARREASKRWRQENKAYLTAKIKEWHAANPDAANRYARERAARKRRDGGHHTQGEFLEVLGQCGGVCVYCGAPATTKDHVVPVIRGGTDGIANIVPACKPCNSQKSDQSMLVWMVRRTQASCLPL